MSGIINFGYDQLNNFGQLSAAGNFPNVLDLGEASVERMTVDLKLPIGAVTASTALTLKVQGSNTNGNDFVDIVSSGNIAAADLNKDGYGLPIPKNNFRYLRVALGGTISAGAVQAILNTTVGP